MGRVESKTCRFFDAVSADTTFKEHICSICTISKSPPSIVYFCMSKMPGLAVHGFITERDPLGRLLMVPNALSCDLSRSFPITISILQSFTEMLRFALLFHHSPVKSAIGAPSGPDVICFIPIPRSFSFTQGASVCPGVS